MPARGPLSLAILISGRGSNLAAIARACAEERFGARVALVIADRDTAAGLTGAAELGLATRLIPFREHPERADFDAALGAAIAGSGADLIVLAGFMRILTEKFVTAHTGRLLNIHPSLLPKFKGLHTHRRALEAGEALHGASVHYVTPELDGGPPVLQGRITVRPGESEARLSARVHAVEHIIYPRAIGWIAGGRLAWDGTGPCFDGRPLRAPIVEDFDAI